MCFIRVYDYRQAWDLAVDICLSQLPTIIEEGTAFRVSVFAMGPKYKDVLGVTSEKQMHSHTVSLCDVLLLAI